MTWALKLGGTKYGTFADINIPANTTFDIKFGYAYADSGHGRPFGRNAYNNYNSRCLLFYNSQEIRLTDNSGNHASFTAPTYTRTDYNEFRFSRDINNDVTCYLNETPIGTVSNFSGQILFNQTGRHATVSYASEGGLSFFDVTINSSLVRNYNADISDHGAVAPKMLSTASGAQYITGQNMASNGDAWLEFSGGTAPVIPQFSLTGGVTDDSVNIVGRVDTASTTLVIEYADNANFDNSSATSVLAVDADFLVKATLTGLTANTHYYYRYVDNGTVIADVFEFKTNNQNQQYSFKMGFGGCSRSIASTTWDRLKVRDLDGFIGLGDLPYIDDETVDGLPQKAAYFTWLARSDVRSLFDKFSYDYMWDDHDFGANDSIGTNPAKLAQQANYRNIFPNYPLAQASDAIYHAYTRGRVRFIVPDLRSDRGTHASGVMIDSAQMTWFKQELTDFKAQRDLGKLRAVVICSSVQWTDNTRSESWSRAPAQRKEITDHAVSLGVEGEMIAISSNLHALGADSGANNTYGTGGAGGFPHYCGSAMATDITTETDTGEYDLGIFGSSNGGSKHQYGVLEFIDSGSDFSIVFNGYNAVDDSLLVTHTLVTPSQVVVPPTSEVNAIVTETVMQSQLSNIVESNNISVIEAEQKTEYSLHAVAHINQLTAVITEQLSQSTTAAIDSEQLINSIESEQLTQSEVLSINEAQLIFSVQAQQLTEAITVNVIANGAQDVNVVITEQNTQAQAVSLDELQLVQAIITEQITQSINSDIAENTLINAVTTEQISESVIVNIDESSGIFISVVQTEQLTQAINSYVDVEAIVNAVVTQQLTQHITHQIDVDLTVSAVVAEQLTQADLIHVIEQNIAFQLNIDIDQISLEILTPIYTIEHLH